MTLNSAQVNRSEKIRVFCVLRKFRKIIFNQIVPIFSENDILQHIFRYTDRSIFELYMCARTQELFPMKETVDLIV